LLFSAYALISGRTFLFKAVVYNFANIDDYKKFSNNTVAIGKPQPWHVSAGYNKPVFRIVLTVYWKPGFCGIADDQERFDRG
jgi:ribonuclease I